MSNHSSCVKYSVLLLFPPKALRREGESIGRARASGWRNGSLSLGRRLEGWKATGGRGGPLREREEKGHKWTPGERKGGGRWRGGEHLVLGEHREGEQYEEEGVLGFGVGHAVKC